VIIMAVKYGEERVFTIPLRKVFAAERTKRAKRAIELIRAFLERHMKGEVKIGKSINESVWARGIQKPPRRVRVHAVKEKINGVDVVFSELVGVEIKKPSADEIKKKLEKEKEKEKKKKEERKERKQKAYEEEMGIKQEKKAEKEATGKQKTERRETEEEENKKTENKQEGKSEETAEKRQEEK